jgi:hypothetical protein
MQPPVIFLIGQPQHGKSVARSIVCKLTGLKGASCSDVICGFLAERRGVSYESIRSLPKEQTRAEFVTAGDWLCGMDVVLKEKAKDETVDADMFRVPSALVRTLYHAGYNVIDGVRRALELEESFKHLHWNGIRTLTIWIERPNGPVVVDNTTIKKEQADEVVLNDGSEADLVEKLHAVLLKYFPPPPKKEPVILGAAGNVPSGGAILDGSGNVAGAHGERRIIKPFSAL